ncbi:MAG: UDP-N-acetylglucosamine--N-acetylmuramyl-(pentapeptide) pyrophosphoryl-undecaprenol N-acetylglucosamine transferase [Anaerolineales bacterium]|nr:UDP-N-acetylglucosamine--N-acetylmuramyl-(pentapeptide) pyrophosphoryl-undecaprenol N-acetylglucosamine transferase [Anaerolineales bacterium]
MYPALSVAQTLMTDRPEAAGAAADQVLWIGGLGGMEVGLITRAGLPFQAIHGGGVHGVGWRLPLNVLNLVRGVFEAWGRVRAFRPDVLLVTGGFITMPVALAAWLNRVPVLVYLPDIEPGLAIKAVAAIARRIAVTVADSRAFLRGKELVVTGYPTRPDLARADRAAARAHLGLSGDRPVVLVTGGSRGAHSLNSATLAALPDWLRDYAVVHLAGEHDWPAVEQARAALPEALKPHYHAFPFLHEMGLALAAADLVVSRAGASALGEYPLFGLPAVLVPYPYAWRYQKVNADYLVQRGAAVQLADEALGVQLAGAVRNLLSDPARLAAMRTAARAAAVPEAAQNVVRELRRLAADGGAVRP